MDSTWESQIYANLIWGDSREVEYAIIWLDQMISGSVIYLVDALKEIKSKWDIISNSLGWIRAKFFMSKMSNLIFCINSNFQSKG